MKPLLNKKILIATVGLALVGYAVWSSNSSPETPATPKAAAASVENDTLHFAANAPQLTFLQIKTVEAFPEPLVESLNARIAYDDNHTARVYSPIAGRVTKIAAETAKQVNAGDELLQLDSPDFSQATADSAKADADLLRKKLAYERAQALYETQGMARKDVELAEADLRQAEAESERAKARLKNLYAHSETRDGHFVLRAPISGVISERQVNAGSEVRPDAPNPLFVIADLQHLWVLVDLPERQLSQIKVGQLISVEVDAYPDETFSGRVAIISETLDPVTRRVQVRCEVDNKHRKLKPEMFARVTPVADADSTLPRVPNSALFTQGLYSFLFVELSPGVLQRRRVSLDFQGRDYTYVREGLRPGEKVVTTGALLLNSELAESD